MINDIIEGFTERITAIHGKLLELRIPKGKENRCPRIIPIFRYRYNLVIES